MSSIRNGKILTKQARSFLITLNADQDEESIEVSDYTAAKITASGLSDGAVTVWETAESGSDNKNQVLDADESNPFVANVTRDIDQLIAAELFFKKEGGTESSVLIELLLKR